MPVSTLPTVAALLDEEMDVQGNALAAATALAGGTVNGLVHGVVAWS
jgi:hypothetical protein